MKKTVLLYNFSEERLAGVKRALIPLKAAAKVVAKESYGETIGYLAGIEGFAPTATAQPEDFDEELLVMCGFNSSDIDMLIKLLRKYGVGRVALKAVITPTNAEWNGSALYHAVRADHEEMLRRREQGQ